MRCKRRVGPFALSATVVLAALGVLTIDSAEAGRATGTLSVRVVVVAPSCGAQEGRDCERTTDTSASTRPGVADTGRELPAFIRYDREGNILVRTLVY